MTEPSKGAIRAAEEIVEDIYGEFPSYKRCKPIAAIIDHETGSPLMLEALRVALLTLDNLNGKVDYDVWKSLFEPMKMLRAAIAAAENGDSQ